jgi:hypothetical protein
VNQSCKRSVGSEQLESGINTREKGPVPLDKLCHLGLGGVGPFAFSYDTEYSVLCTPHHASCSSQTLQVDQSGQSIAPATCTRGWLGGAASRDTIREYCICIPHGVPYCITRYLYCHVSVLRVLETVCSIRHSVTEPPILTDWSTPYKVLS